MEFRIHASFALPAPALPDADILLRADAIQDLSSIAIRQIHGSNKGIIP